MSMPFLITMTGIVFGKKLLKIRSWTNIIILWLTNNLHSTRLMGWKDLIPQIQTGFFPAVCFSLTTKLYLHKFTFICYISAQWTYLQPPLLSYLSLSPSPSRSLMWDSFCVVCRCSWGIFHRESSHSNVKFVLLSLVQWGWPVYFSWSAKFCLHLPEIEKDESQQNVLS